MNKSTLLACLMLIVSIRVSSQNELISNGILFDGEPYIAVDPTNSQHLVVAWMSFVPLHKIAIKTTRSLDGGETWSNPEIIKHFSTTFGSADPSLAFDVSGAVYLCYIDFSRAVDSGYVFVRKSNNGGITWGKAVQVIKMHAETNKLAIDRPWMVIDQSNSSNKGNVYVTTMNAEGATPPFNPYFMVSKNGGLSFEPWRHLDTTAWLSGSLVAQPMPAPAVSKDGRFYAVYPSYVFSQNLIPQYILASSNDGGKHFEYNTVFASSITFNDTLAKKGYLLRTNPANSQHLAFFFLYSPDGDADVYLIESFDVGKTWSNPLRVNDDPKGNNRMQDLVWADFDYDGDLIVSWRDRRNAPDSSYETKTEIWAAVRHKDSSNFGANFQLTDTQVAFDTVLNESGNDFMSIQLVNDTLSAVWGDTRTGTLSIWFSRMTIEGKLLSIRQINSENSIDVYPNPFTNEVTLKGQQINLVEVVGIKGEILNSQKYYDQQSQIKLDLSNLNTGIYIIRMHDEMGMHSTRIVKE